MRGTVALWTDDTICIVKVPTSLSPDFPIQSNPYFSLLATVPWKRFEFLCELIPGGASSPFCLNAERTQSLGGVGPKPRRAAARRLLKRSPTCRVLDGGHESSGTVGL